MFRKQIEDVNLVIPNHTKLQYELRTFVYELTATGAMKLHHLANSSDDFVDSLMFAVWGTKEENEFCFDFLNKKEIREILFFPELDFEEDIPYAIVKTEELEKFLIENVNTITNTHISDMDFNWIFTITHEDDFFISGSKKLVKEFIGFFKNAKCTSYKELEEKWKNKK